MGHEIRLLERREDDVAIPHLAAVIGEHDLAFASKPKPSTSENLLAATRLQPVGTTDFSGDYFTTREPMLDMLPRTTMRL